MSPTSRTLERLADQGYLPDVVERQLGRLHKSDLFGMIDVVAVRGEQTLAVQATSYSNVPARVNKIAASPHLSAVEAAGWRLVVWGWRADGRVREVVMLPGRLCAGWPEQMELPL